MKKLLIGLLAITSIYAFSSFGTTSFTIPDTEVEFQISGKPLEIKKAFMTIRCLRSATFTERLNNGTKEYETCDDFAVNGSSVTSYESKIELQKLGTNIFLLKQQAVDFSKNRKGHTCMRISVELQRTPGDTADVFLTSADKYSLLSYCTVGKLPFSTNAYIYNNRRTNTLNDFYTKLDKPIMIQLKN